MAFLDTRSYDGTPISRRVDDGYYNLTAMCQAGGKQWRDYVRLNRCAEQLSAISRSVQIRTDLLTTSVTTGPNEQRGTWGHKLLAYDLACWISADVSVWMHKEFDEKVINQAQKSQPVALLSASFTADMEAARLIADMVEFGGKDKSISLAQSLTVIGKKHPQHAELCFESQRILCPEAKQWGSQAKVLERITEQLGEDKVTQLAAKCKEVGLISKKNPNWIVNKALCEMGLQYENRSHTLSQAHYVATAEGQKYSKEETRPANNQEEKWVPQLLWLVNETANLILEFLPTRLSRKA